MNNFVYREARYEVSEPLSTLYYFCLAVPLGFEPKPRSFGGFCATVTPRNYKILDEVWKSVTGITSVSWDLNPE